ncbi:MAG: hypothetical protein ACPH2J_00570 [Akkermansiaceae bacterium]
MPGAGEAKQQWDGLVCPVCRFVFRVPVKHKGAGVVCPACAHLLQIPSPQQRRMALGAMPQTFDQAALAKGKMKSTHPSARPQLAQDAVGNTGIHEVSSRSSPSESSPAWGDAIDGDEADLPAWEQDRPAVVSAPVSVLTWILGGSMLGFAVVALCIWFMTQSADKVVERYPQAESSLPENEKLQGKPEEVIFQPDEAGSIESAKKIVTQFLEAQTSAALEPLVRTPDISIARLRAWHAKYPWVRPGVRVAGLRNSVKMVGDTVSMNVRLDDFSVKKIHLIRGRDGYKVDWESWVAWCSTAWDDLFDTKPSEPVEVRVKCKRVSYYNGVFNDDEKWFSVRLSHPDFDRSIYGYIDTTQPRFYGLVSELIRGTEIPLTLKISYPPNTEFNNQVSIVDYVQSGWVRPNTAMNSREGEVAK